MHTTRCATWSVGARKAEKLKVVQIDGVTSNSLARPRHRAKKTCIKNRAHFFQNPIAKQAGQTEAPPTLIYQNSSELLRPSEKSTNGREKDTANANREQHPSLRYEKALLF